MLKNISLVIALAGILFLLSLLNFSAPLHISNNQELLNLQENQKVLVHGKILSERTAYENTKLIKIDRNMTLLCNSCIFYGNKTIEIVGIIQKYKNQTEIKVLRISEND